MSVQVNCEKNASLRRISALGLAVYDTILYLDTHDCPEAQQYLYKKRDEYIEAVRQYEEKYGVITHLGHPECDVHWAWQLD